MAYSPVQLLSVPIENYDAYWLKFYDQGTTNPLAMATDATGGTLIAQAEISSGGTVPAGFLQTAGSALLNPFVDGDYDAWLFPTEAEAVANDTSNAIQLADNLNADPASTVNDTGLTATDKASAVLITPVAGITLFVESSDGGWFQYKSGVGLTDNGGSYCGTQFIPTGGDGSIAWVRVDWGYNMGLGYQIAGWGVTSDGVTDDTANAQVAVDYISSIGGGKLLFPIATCVIEGLVPKNYVILQGHNTALNTINSGDLLYGSKLLAAGNGGNIIDHHSGAAKVFDFSMDGFLLQGAGAAAVTGMGILLSDTRKCNLTNLSFDNFADNAIKILEGNVNVVDKIFAQRCLMNRTRTQKDGVIDINGADHYISRLEATTSQGTDFLGGAKTSANLYCCAVAIRADTCFVDTIQAELSDVGMYITGIDARYSNIRADLNQGHGFELVGATGNTISNCNGYRNSLDTTNTYDQWIIDSSSFNNHFSNCIGRALQGEWAARYAFNDSATGDATRNYYSNCRGYNSATSEWNLPANFGAAVSFTSGGLFSLTDASATPSVEQYTKFKTGATGVTITAFYNGVSGQEITIISKGAIVFDTSTATRLIGSSVDITTASGDITKWVCETGGTTASSWRLTGFVDVSVDNSAGA